MKQNYFIIIIFCLLSVSITAQPVLTYSGNAPQIGDVYNASGIPYGGSFDPGPAGGNQNWDFSDIQPIISTSSAVVDAASTPFVDDFPDATIAYVNIPTTNTYSYQQLTTSEMFYVGVVMDSDINHFPDSRKEMQYPFSYNDVYTDTYLFIFPSDLMLIHTQGTITVTADAWGSVKTPAGSYNSTLRLKKENVYTDSVWNTGGVLMSVTTYYETFYDWYTATSHYPVLSIMVTDEGASSIAYATQTGGIEDNQLLSQITVWPNPADNIICVKFSDEITDKIEIEVVGLTGQSIMPLKESGNRQFSADISRLIPGTYLLLIKTGSGGVATSRFIKR